MDEGTRINRRVSSKRWTYKGKTRYMPVVVQDFPERDTRIVLNEPLNSSGAAKSVAQEYINNCED